MKPPSPTRLYGLFVLRLLIAGKIVCESCGNVLIVLNSLIFLLYTLLLTTVNGLVF